MTYDQAIHRIRLEDYLLKVVFPSDNATKERDMEAKQDIGLGDVVSLGWNDGYDSATVCQVHSNGKVDLFRPYTHTADFSCAGRNEGSLSVIPYVGVETIKDVDPSRLKVIRKNRVPVR